MIKKIWNKVFNSPKHSVSSTPPKVLSREQHCVSRKNISRNALKVLHRLNGEGFQAYLVGGGVRDLLLGLSPKDFDIATDATPEQVAKIFRNSRLIGRRFKLAHILFGREVIEVATFRASHEESSSIHAKTSAQGMLVRDNVYGNLEQDAYRRDFTVNALYYCAKDFTIHDFTGGLADLEKRQLRLIGDPIKRYQEDPVRILRAIRLSCKLGLTIEKTTLAPIKDLAEMLGHVSPARLWDESSKLLLAGYAQSTWTQLVKLGIAKHLFAQTISALNDTANKSPQSQLAATSFKHFIDAALNSTDNRIAQSKPVTPAFLFAVFLWQPLQNLTKQLIHKGLLPYEAAQKAAVRVVDIQRQSIAIPKRFSLVAKEIWAMQNRLEFPKKRAVEGILQNPRFRAAYDFLCLRAGDEAHLKAMADWWTEIQTASPEKKHKMIKQLQSAQPKSSKKNKRKKAYRPRKKTNQSDQ
ncbi:polynucleotide adenylyltransferase PcnB [Aliikangiella sp. IMCC44653]